MNIILRFLVVLLFSSSVSFAKNPDKSSDILAVVEQSGSVDFYDAVSGDRLGGTPVDVNAHEITLSADGNTAYVSNFGIQDYDETIGIPGDSISIINTHTFQETGRLSTGTKNAPHGVKIRPNHPDELYVNTEIDGKIIVFNVVSQNIKKTLNAPAGTHNFIFSEDGNTLWLIAGANGVTKMDPESGQVLGEYHTDTPIRGLEYTPDQKSLMASAKNQIRFFDPESLETLHTIDNLGVDQFLYSAMTPDGKTIVAPAVWNNEILIIDTKTDQVIKRIVTGVNPVTVVIDAKGRYAYVSNARNSHVAKIDLKTFTVKDIDTKAGPNGLVLIHRPHEISHSTSSLPQFTIGAVLPLTGKDQDIGRDIMLGFEFWRDTVNRNRTFKINGQTYKVKIVYRDMQSDRQLIHPLADEMNIPYQLNGFMGYYDHSEGNIVDPTYNNLYIFIDGYDRNNLYPGFLQPYASEQALMEDFQKTLNLPMRDYSLRAYISMNFIEPRNDYEN